MKDPEEPLLDSYPVFYEYTYIADGKVISSDVQGTIGDLKKDLKSQGISANNIYKYLPWNYSLITKE